MSSFLTAFTRSVPKAAGRIAGGGACVRPVRARGQRTLLSRPLSGLHRISVDSGSSGPQPVSALAHSSVGPTQPQPRQLWRSFSNQSNEVNHESNQESVPIEGATVSEDDPVHDTASTAEETDTTVETSEAAAQGDETSGDEHLEAADAAPTLIPLVQVDGISFSMPQEAVEQWFKDAGVTPAKVTLVMRPPQSSRAGQNKGRAFVELENEEDTLKCLKISGRSMGDRWVSISRLETPLEECCTISVRGLKDISEGDFKQFLEEETGVAPVSVKVLPDNPIRNQNGLAFADFETPEQAQKALSLDGMNIMSRWIDVSLHIQKKRMREPRTGTNANSPPFGVDVKDGMVVVMKGLPFSLSDDEIKAFLSQYGITDEDIVEMKVPKHQNTVFNTGLAFLLLKDESVVEKAIALKGTHIGERWVDVSMWGDRTKSPRMSNKSMIEATRTAVPAELRKKYPDLPCVVVSGLPFHKSKTEVSDYLAEQGIPQTAVEEMQMPLFLSTQNNTGACWLVINEEEAYNRIMSLNGAIMDDRWVTIADA